jgi:hypothetical protein
MTYRLEFTIAGKPKATNALLGASYWKKHKNAKEWKNWVWIACFRELPPAPLTKAKLILTRYNYRTLDYDGLVASFKPVVDGLVEAGVLQNDTWKITGTWDVRQAYAPKGKEHIRVVVESVSKLEEITGGSP